MRSSTDPTGVGSKWRPPAGQINSTTTDHKSLMSSRGGFRCGIPIRHSWVLQEEQLAGRMDNALVLATPDGFDIQRATGFRFEGAPCWASLRVPFKTPDFRRDGDSGDRTSHCPRARSVGGWPALNDAGVRFQELFHEFYPRVVSFFRGWRFSREEAEDLAQETFVKAHAGISSFRQDASVKTWIFRIARNTGLNALRSRSAEKRSGIETPLEEMTPRWAPVSKVASPEEQLVGKEILLKVRELWTNFPPQMQRCVFLRYDQELKYREIAAVMQLSLETVKSHLYEARQRLLQHLGNDLKAPPRSGEENGD